MAELSEAWCTWHDDSAMLENEGESRGGRKRLEQRTEMNKRVLIPSLTLKYSK